MFRRLTPMYLSANVGESSSWPVPWLVLFADRNKIFEWTIVNSITWELRRGRCLVDGSDGDPGATLRSTIARLREIAVAGP